VPFSQTYPAGFEEIRCRVPDLTRIRATIGYAPRYRLEDIVREAAEWRRG
jgi:UDP-glucose 4-epimerase